ncbi:MAG: hypothetical protein ACPG5B_15015 [Chitinophagales bacterium]
MKKISLFLLICFFFFNPTFLFSQETVIEKTKDTKTYMADVVYLKNGSIIKGNIIELLPSKSVKIELLDGSIFVFEMETVVKIAEEAVALPTWAVEEIEMETKKELDKTGVVQKKAAANIVKHIPTKGFYNVLGISYLSGRDRNDNVAGGFGAEYILGYQKNQWLSFGGGIAANNYGEASFISLFTDFRGYLRNSSASPYYSLGLGYGFNNRRDWDILDATSGFYINPNIGIRASAKKARHFLVGFGIKMQKSTVTRNWENNPLQINTPDKMLYTRFNIRYALLF